VKKFVLLATGLLLAAVVVEAHHPFAENFNSDAPVTVKGVVTRIDWTTPHTWIYVNAKDINGSVQRWAFQVAASTVLMERGWNRDDVKVGDEVTIDGFEANEVLQNRIYTGNARAITFPSGRRVLSGSPSDGGPPPRGSS
jgi:hypothetical protein